MAEEHGTPLSSAHERFRGSLPTRVRELHGLALLLAQAPSDERAAEQLRRRLHALFASAQLFHEESVLAAIKPVLSQLDAARDERRTPEPAEVDAVVDLCVSLEPGALESVAEGPRSAPPARWGAPLVEPAPTQSGLTDAPLLVTQTVAGTAAAQDVIAVLLVASREVEAEVRAALPAERCEVTSTHEPETAALVIGQISPDLVLVESGLLCVGGEKLARELRDDRNAVVGLVPEHASDAEAQLARTFADAVVRLPLGRAGLVERLQRLAGRGVRAPSALEQIHAGTVDEIASSVAEDVRRGIAGALRTGKGERIELGDKSELLAATWSAVARIRAHIAQRAHGRVRYEEPPFAGAPLSLALGGEAAPPLLAAAAPSLAGLRVLIADDDPAVTAFFGELVREAGGNAIEARDGAQALELMRRRAPDLLVSDILMPEIDGFTLCRELRRDLALAHVPVILLSWKEDFLQRMRELESGATGYLRKEASASQALAMFGEALRPRMQLCELLDTGDEVQGRVDTIGTPLLVSLVASRRHSARVRVRDAWNLFEIDLRDGAIAVTATAADGTFVRGEAALRQLVGVEVGRFSVGELDGPLRGALPAATSRALADALHELAGLLDAVSDTTLLRAVRVDLDDEVLRPLLAATPTLLADLVARLRAGEAPKELVVSGVLSARELEQHLRELARRGAVRAVWGEGGEDLAGTAREARQERPSELRHVSASGSRPPPAPTVLGEADVEWLNGGAVQEVGAPLASRPSTHGGTPPPIPGAVIDFDQVLPSERPSAMPPELPIEPSAGELEVLEEVLSLPPPPAGVAAVSGPPSSARPAPLHSPPPLPHTERPVRARARALLTASLFGMVVVGYCGTRLLLRGDPAPTVSPPVTATVPAPSELSEPRSSLANAPSEALQAGPQTLVPEGDSLAEPAGELRLLPFIDKSRGISVAADEGLLVIEHEASAVGPRVRALERDLGTAPVAVALPAGRHQVELQRAGQVRFRVVSVRAGQTTILDASPTK